MAPDEADSDRRRRIAAAAERALAEAESRRAGAATPSGAGEVSGPAGPEPTRYGDWERVGIARDF